MSRFNSSTRRRSTSTVRRSMLSAVPFLAVENGGPRRCSGRMQAGSRSVRDHWRCPLRISASPTRCRDHGSLIECRFAAMQRAEGVTGHGGRGSGGVPRVRRGVGQGAGRGPARIHLPCDPWRRARAAPAGWSRSQRGARGIVAADEPPLGERPGAPEAHSRREGRSASTQLGERRVRGGPDVVGYCVEHSRAVST